MKARHLTTALIAIAAKARPDGYTILQINNN